VALSFAARTGIAAFLRPGANPFIARALPVLDAGRAQRFTLGLKTVRFG